MNYEGWVVAIAHGKDLVGKPMQVAGSSKTVLLPGYELKSAVVPGRGVPEVQRACYPVLWFASLKEIPLPTDAFTIPIATLDRSDRRAIELAISKCEEGIRLMRGRDRGLVVPPTEEKS